MVPHYGSNWDQVLPTVQTKGSWRVLTISTLGVGGARLLALFLSLALKGSQPGSSAVMERLRKRLRGFGEGPLRVKL